MINELRIGNYVLTGFMNPSPSGLHKCFNKCEVKSIGIEKVIVTEKIGRKGLEKHNYENLKPIPLTEEWLLKFGFIYNGWSYNFKRYVFHSQGKNEKLEFYNTEFGISKNKEVFNISYKIEYVHQLQNIYFALTNEELTFKPNL